MCLCYVGRAKWVKHSEVDDGGDVGKTDRKRKEPKMKVIDNSYVIIC